MDSAYYIPSYTYNLLFLYVTKKKWAVINKFNYKDKKFEVIYLFLLSLNFLIKIFLIQFLYKFKIIYNLSTYLYAYIYYFKRLIHSLKRYIFLISLENSSY